jgi:hypothetical protein
MHASHLLCAGALFAGVGLLFSPGDPTTTTTTSPPPAAEGHYVLVVEGDRDRLQVTHCRHKPDPWAGVPKGFTSEWSLVIRDGSGAVLAHVPLDVARFATDAAQQGKAVRSTGCIVHDPRIAMLVNVPCHAAAASYTFARGKTPLGEVDGDAVRRLAGGGR